MNHEIGGMGRGPAGTNVEGLYLFTCSCTVENDRGATRHWRTAWGTVDQAWAEIHAHIEGSS